MASTEKFRQSEGPKIVMDLHLARQLILHLADAPLRATEHHHRPVVGRIGGAPHHAGSSSPPPRQSASWLQAAPLHGQARWWSVHWG